jgi:alpha-L-fucosidase
VSDPQASKLLPAGAEWFTSARFGMFVHWGHSSQQGIELSWPMAGGVEVLPASRPMPVADYEASAATFAPRPGAAERWAELASRAGMTYAVFTARHHDGFSMWPTALGEYSVATSPCGRDLVREFVDAFRAAGLRVGLYYSLPDWHHPDYPALTDDDRPYAFGTGRRSDPDGWARYTAYLFGQIDELLTGYGTIDLLWFDGAWERTPAEWRTADLEMRIRSLQPSILINDRLPGAGDFDTPEQFVPAEPPRRPWETCMTMNEAWGYVPDDTDYKSPRHLVHTLCEVAARGGNLLLNVSPRGDGSVPTEQAERLDAIGAWMDSHRESIIGTAPGLAPWQWYGPSTRRGDRVYLHLLAKPYDTVTARGIPVARVRAVRDLATGAPLDHRTRVSVLDRIIANTDPLGEVVIDVPEKLVDDVVTVIELELTPRPPA